MKKLLYVSATCLLMVTFCAAQKIWVGAGADNNWLTPANWSSNTIPVSTDDVVLDNTFIPGDYTITLPDAVSITLKSIRISPATGKVIQLVIATTNLLTPALSTTGPGYGIQIDNGGIFINASLATSGTNLVIADSLKINTGGRYKHSSRTAHANNIVRVVSKAPGTEKGVFEFDVPGAGYTVSASGRTFGTLVLHSIESALVQSYSCSGINPLTIRGNLEIGVGTTFSINLSNDVFIGGDLIQQGGAINLATQPNSTKLLINGNINQAAGDFTESSTGLPTIELSGTENHSVNLGGAVLNQVAFRLNTSGITTLSSSLNLPYRLELVNGKLLSTAANLLILQPGCTVLTDSTSNNSFVAGPLKKIGLSSSNHFLFPVGKNNSMRWVELKNATGDFTIEYFNAPATSIGTQLGAGLQVVSGLEYWTIIAEGTTPTANVELSFNNVNSGGITNLADLRVAKFTAGMWTDAGFAATTGSAGAAGSVLSNSTGFSAGSNYFSLASSSFLNPLPLKLVKFSAKNYIGTVNVDWQIDTDFRPLHFILERSMDRSNFNAIGILNYTNAVFNYKYVDANPMEGVNYYRLKLAEQNGSFIYSKIATVYINNNYIDVVQLYPTVVQNELHLKINSGKQQSIQVSITDYAGRIRKQQLFNVTAGQNIYTISVADVQAGVYIIKLTGNNNNDALRFIKQ